MIYKGKKCGIIVTPKKGTFCTAGVSLPVRVDYRHLDNPSENVQSYFLTIIRTWRDEHVTVLDEHKSCNAAVKKSLNKELAKYIEPICKNLLDFVTSKGKTIKKLSDENNDLLYFYPCLFYDGFYENNKNNLEIEKSYTILN